MAKPIITLEQLKAILSYDPETGEFTWRIRMNCNHAHVGAIAGTLDERNCRNITIARKHYKAHRLAWLWMTGQWPRQSIDHIDGNPSNNRFTNLRDVSHAANKQNLRKAHGKNTSLGTRYNKRNKNWNAQICTNGKFKHLGVFVTAEEAHAAYVAAKRLLHPFGTL